MHLLIFSIVIALGAALVPQPAVGQGSVPMKIIVPAAPGGGSDVWTRTVADRLSVELKQNIFVENRPGAGGSISAEVASRAAPDGQTLYVGTTSTMVLLPLAMASVGYDPIRDFLPITQFIQADIIIVARSSLNIKSLRELVSHAKANPGKLNYGTGGLGTTQHLAAELLCGVAGIDLTHIPYKGTAFAQTDLVGGRIDLMFDNVPPAIAFIREGKTRVLAVASPKRSAQLRDTPTTAEEGYPAVEIFTWAGLFAPKGTPQGVIQRVNAAMKTVLEMPDVREKLTLQGNNDANAYTTPEQLGAFLQGEIDKWRTVIRQRNLKL